MLAEHGLPVIEPLLGTWSEAWGHEAVAKLFDSDGKGTGPTPSSAATTRSRAASSMRCANAASACPDDVGVIGFDNWEIVAEATRPPLTSVDMNLAALGREAGLALLSLVGGQPAEPGIRKLPCRLVVRQSCGRPPGG